MNGGDSPLSSLVVMSLRWKLRWQLQAAHLRASREPFGPAGMNSPQPSMEWPPMATAWFFKHSL